VEYLGSIVRIVIINLALSGDNAVVIGMAAHRLPLDQRHKAIVFGGTLAIVLRVILTVVAALPLNIPALRLIGGLLLVWIAFKLLKEEEDHEGARIATTMREAILTIVIADLIMSTDNVLGVAAASEGNLGLLIFGLILSMAIVMFMGNFVAGLLNRFWWLSYLGAGVIAWTGGAMFFEDKVVIRFLPALYRINTDFYVTAVTVATLIAAHWIHRARKAS